MLVWTELCLCRVKCVYIPLDAEIPNVLPVLLKTLLKWPNRNTLHAMHLLQT